MGKENNLKDFLTDVADAIREKKGTTEKINPQAFAEEIKNLPSGDNGLADSIITRTITEYVNNDITKIGSYAFYSCTNLVRVECKNLTIGGFATFNNCTSLTSVELPKLRNIDMQFLYNCTALLSLTLPSATSVGTQGLRSIPNCKTIDLPSCTSINAFGLESCNALTALVLSADSLCALGNVNALNNTPIANGTGYVYVPDDLVDAYKEATNWSTYASQIKGLSELPNE